MVWGEVEWEFLRRPQVAQVLGPVVEVEGLVRASSQSFLEWLELVKPELARVPVVVPVMTEVFPPSRYQPVLSRLLLSSHLRHPVDRWTNYLDSELRLEIQTCLFRVVSR